jgi:hypothetical protein
VEKGDGTGTYELGGMVIKQVGSSLTLEQSGNITTLLNWQEKDYGITLEKKDKPDDDVSDSGKTMWSFYSPIALDINKGGTIQTIPLASSSVYFDIDNDGFAENVQWLSPTDGWLALDRNGNGKIDNQTELFGDNGGTSAYANDNYIDRKLMIDSIAV